MNFKYFLVPLMVVLTISCNTKKEDVGTSVEKETPVIPADYDPEKKLKELGITLTEASAPVANYVNAVRSGNLIFLSGKGPLQSNGENIEGKVGTDLTIEEGYEAARITGINQLSVLKSELGNLNKVVRVVKVLGMVNAGPDFPDHPKVINGYSDLMVAVFGERGKHARAAVGMGSLPGNIAVEIEMIVEVMPD
ncbi:RidA family protein [Arenibacter palladensis]|uniref:RidA family protein n=1 Tax=Arenibacter palladensis TaxID=237373 RepID=UPI002FD4772E